MAGTLVVGANPALQKSMYFEQLKVGGVNRASKLLFGVGGKGQNAARALQRLSPGSVVLVHPLGGSTGETIEKALGEEGVRQVVVRVAGATRVCTTLLQSTTDDATELIDPSAPLTPEEATQFIAAIKAELASPALRAIVVCGTVPPGAEALYESLANAKAPQQLLVLDCFKGIEGALSTGKVDVLKVNVDEVRALCKSEDGGLPELTKILHQRYGLRVVAVTDGCREGFVSTSDGRQWWVPPPRLPDGSKVVNPIGAGDTCTAGMAEALVEGLDPHIAMARGQAAATASCATDSCAVFDVALARSLAEGVTPRACA
eukprot:Hpha_TRINITY_DN26446_c0_g1::TRINITY_DN26446_c0_g1_i1::g.34015::m.34015/K00917/lacC; tagatose 6-phosphate kinase